MDAVRYRYVGVNGVRLHIAEQGEGPLVLLLHGFIECWYSWRHQFAPLAGAGYHVVAPDQRGFARSDAPKDIDAYTMLDLAGDIVALIHALGEERAVVVGHDFGAPVAWITALLRPDLVRGVAGMSVPPGMSPMRSGSTHPLSVMRSMFGNGFYILYFQQPGVADAELDEDLRTTFRRMLYRGAGENPRNNPPRPWTVSPSTGLLDPADDPDELPGWLTEDDIDTFAAEYAANGFTGSLNWYRTINRSWELLAPWSDAVIQPPALFIAGDRDRVPPLVGGLDKLLTGLPALLPNLRRTVTLPGCGHWTEMERPAEVNAALLEFIAEL
ncbi:alpha/beta fold hydrolase [Streptomyces sp. NPDC001404]|uniref:alpha/beta fold hydrolase n=1 Tax=Streptomyces sp. NPDC001404 TaxID=3364571 RepID=UPI0036AE020F